MIATHITKAFNARVTSPALTARILHPVNPNLVCSQTTQMEREYWAAPRDAAEIKLWKEQALAHIAGELEPSVPDFIAPTMKQVLLPIDWRQDHYVAVTPVASAGLMHELYQRLEQQRLPYKEWVVQQNMAAWANHGETILQQKGRVRLLRRGVSKIEASNWRGSFVQFTARCEGANVSTGMIAVGLPAITALGGFVHVLERKTGAPIEFAIGLQSSQWYKGTPRTALHKNSASSSTAGKVNGGGKVTVVPGSSREEIRATCEIVLLLRSDKVEPKVLEQALEGIHRFAGGSLFDIKIQTVEDGHAPAASYLLDAAQDVQRLKNNNQIDSLQAALDMYALDGQWVEQHGEKVWFQLRNGYTLNQNGYAFFEEPRQREGARDNHYPHAWAEPTFALITQGSMSDSAWWTRKSTPSGVFWQGV